MEFIQRMKYPQNAERVAPMKQSRTSTVTARAAKATAAVGSSRPIRPPIKTGMQDSPQGVGTRKRSDLCGLLLRDAARLLNLGPDAWHSDGRFVAYCGLHHHLIPVELQTGSQTVDVACYMLRLPLRPTEPSWAAFMLDLNLILVPNTGLCIGAHPSIGLGLLCRLSGDELNPYTLAEVMETASSTVPVLLQRYWGGELPR